MPIRGEPGSSGGDPMGPLLIGCAVAVLLLVGLGGAGVFLFMRPMPAPTPVVVAAPVPVSLVPPSVPEPEPEPVAEPPIEPSANVIEGALSQDEIRSVIRGDLHSVQRCYEEALRTDPTLAVRVTAHFVIGADGHVTTANVDGSDDVVLTTCIATRVRAWEFPAPRGGGVVAVNYPFVFSPG